MDEAFGEGIEDAFRSGVLRERGIGDGNKREDEWGRGGGGWMTGGGSVVMATHRSATATRNRVEPSRGHIARCRPTRRVATPRYAASIHRHSATRPTHTSSSSIVHGFFFPCIFLFFTPPSLSNHSNPILIITRGQFSTSNSRKGRIQKGNTPPEISLRDGLKKFLRICGKFPP